MNVIGMIRRLKYRDKLSVREICRRTGVSRNTVRKCLRTAEAGEPRYQRRAAVTLLTPFEETLKLWLETDTHRPKQNRRTALMLYADLQKLGFTGSYSRVTEYVRAWRRQGGPSGVKAAFVPLSFALGEAFQFDWSDESLVVGGIYRKLQVAHIKLCASRAFLLVAYPTQTHEMLFDAHTRGFTAFGGVSRRGIYDNMKSAVTKVEKGKRRIVNSRFAAMASHYLFDPDFCNVASGWEKGRVEKDVQDNRRRVWHEAAAETFSNLTALNVWLERRCRQLWTELACPDAGQLTIADVLLMEQAELMPMITPFDGYVEVVAKVSSTCLVTIERSRYSVPCDLAGQKVTSRRYPDRIDVYADDARVATHERSFDRGQVIYDWQHYIPLIERKPGALRNGAPFMDMPAPLQALRRGLLKWPGGDRIMAEVLACVPVRGLDAVLVATELLLESRVLSAEHVKNMLSRLLESPAPAAVETDLHLEEEPKADAARYDGLSDSTVVEVSHA